MGCIGKPSLQCRMRVAQPTLGAFLLEVQTDRCTALTLASPAYFSLVDNRSPPKVHVAGVALNMFADDNCGGQDLRPARVSSHVCSERASWRFELLGSHATAREGISSPTSCERGAN